MDEEKKEFNAADFKKTDSSIKNVVANDIGAILLEANIKQIYVNGKKAQQLYQKYIYPMLQKEAICLPSTSPANAAWSLERLVQEWRKIHGII